MIGKNEWYEVVSFAPAWSVVYFRRVTDVQCRNQSTLQINESEVLKCCSGPEGEAGSQ
jgi:hypothetical protein